ncbi:MULTISPECIES: maleylpyruvate isomerase family mycothiol-dependent enzyme [Streptomyces]|uniref:Maleylpyruvate isomerase family mycothiol-dependent enzyme n=1 Tax=Streptomyces cylindrosporus TaxID=2927583 RepID=A0ABS9Y0I0_9ACTN|nr:maleylpyruvate isomerase family mycothiol-dependent enzyme [Streptomyces cylindrosporus]MCI3270724.1 maleylpyruvate isomerase family mycothiol-dependent enzyme [Streptomyces cylindrosporus]
MSRTFDDARSWAEFGTALFLQAADLDDAGLDAPSALPGWTRKHLVAHVAANADALGNLVHWAATGERTPMYTSSEERAAGIERGAGMVAVELATWLRRSAEALAAAMASLDDAQWQSLVVTAQGRTVPATELPWMRSREVCVHAVDLGTGLTFADLPTGFLAALGYDVVAKRTKEHGPALRLEATDTAASWELPGEGEPTVLAGPVHEITAYLTGREHVLTAVDGGPAPTLTRWL